MPELPEVETVCRGLAKPLEGRRLTAVDVRRPDLRFPLPENLAARLTGRQILSISRRAKYIRAFLDNGEVLVVHLGMSGRMVIDRPETGPAPEKHDHVILLTEDGDRVRFCDPRRFGYMDLIPGDALDAHPYFASLGPEPLGNEFNAPYLAERFAGRKSPVKTALLDQQVVSGLGNIYVCEAMWRSRLSPLKPAGRLVTKAGQPRVTLQRLAVDVRAVISEAIAAGGSSLRDHIRTDGTLGYFQHGFSVYDREGKTCPRPGCGDTVRRIVQSGRSTFLCPRCQKA